MFHRPTKLTLATSFITAILVANMSGPQYVYPSFGTSLAAKFNWTALQNSLVSTASFIGVSFSGPLCAWLVERFGIRGTLRLSGLLAFAGPFLLAQTYAGRLPSHFILCALYLVCLGVAGAAAYLCALDSQSHNFKSYRGMSMGVTSASLGLCGVVFSQIDDHFFTDNDYGLLIFMATVMAGVMGLGAFILGPLTPKSDNDQVAVNHDADENAPLLPSNQRPRDISGFEFFTHPVGFSLFVSLFVCLGLGYVYLASIGQLLLALPTSDATTSSPQHLRNIHVSIFSLSNCAARAVNGILSDVLKKRWGVDRLWMFVGATAGLLATMSYLVTFVSTTEDLLPCTIAVAIMYGTVFGVSPAATTEFGTESFARNWGWLLYAPAIGSQIFNTLFGALYDREAERQGTHLCHGTACFRGTFLFGIGCALACLSVLAWAIVKMRLYRPTKLQ
ncbi:hypothetical protein LRAMOSA07945 [Lichtheimia ramosa]|uniref:Nodulin-like domain-containing protein n=1 Tax=Lichtheimia ramosa TaxID=688394 RepID=A0A077WFK8_9FUNG|nr:hypothetical protein LRAMOSA07945 [Lichtheimia ramosa]